jgi:hypothetical protein
MSSATDAQTTAASDAAATEPTEVELIRLESTCGRVSATEPTGLGGDVYWRLEYCVHGKRVQTRIDGICP